jgi:transcriptional regulator with XRE-family HTH domain
MAASIGEQLRLAREARGIGLREICDQTRISVHYLEAIEADDYKRLPGGVFNRSFIKAYAKCVGYDEREAIEGYTRYLREHGDEVADEVNTHPMHSKVYTDTPATRSPVLTVVLAILILAILTAAALAALHWFQKRAANQLFAPTQQQVNAVLFAPKERYVYSFRTKPVVPLRQERDVNAAALLHRTPNGVTRFLFRDYKHLAPDRAATPYTTKNALRAESRFVAPKERHVYSQRVEKSFGSARSEMLCYALSQTHTPMYNDLTTATTDLRAHDHSRYF